MSLLGHHPIIGQEASLQLLGRKKRASECNQNRPYFYEDNNCLQFTSIAVHMAYGKARLEQAILPL
jgi:hypothetical protein